MKKITEIEAYFPKATTSSIIPKYRFQEKTEYSLNVKKLMVSYMRSVRGVQNAYY